jgi:hypothetical protein
MKTNPFILLLFILFFSTALFSQKQPEGKGKPINANITKKKTEFYWRNFTGTDTTIYNSLTPRIIAQIISNDTLKQAKILVNDESAGNLDIINKGTHYQVDIDQKIKLQEGPNEIYILAKTSNETVKSELKSIIAHGVAGKPEIYWISPSQNEISLITSILPLKVNIESPVKIDSLQLYINGNVQRGFTPVKDPDGGNNISIDYNITLQKGITEIFLVASNSGGSTRSETKIINYKDPGNQKRIALIVGNSKYKSGNILANPKNDAADIAAALKRMKFKVDLLIDADKEPFNKAVERFGDEAKDADISFFYYAGHGVQVNGINYLIATDAKIEQENDVKYNSVDANYVLAQLDAAGSKANIIVMDACRDNPFARSFRNYSRGLAMMDSPTGTLIAYATQPGNTAADGSGKNGLYTTALLKYLEQSQLSLMNIFINVRNKVLIDSEKRQQPWESSSLTSDFYLLK